MVQHQPLQVLFGQVQQFRGQFREECGSTHHQTCSQSGSIGLRTAPSAFVRFPIKGPFGLQERFLRSVKDLHVPCRFGALMRTRHPIGEGRDALLHHFPPESMMLMLHLKEGWFNIRAVGKQAGWLELLQYGQQTQGSIAGPVIPVGHLCCDTAAFHQCRTRPRRSDHRARAIHINVRFKKFPQALLLRITERRLLQWFLQA
mmetsp:Transcript_52845/g.115299  ORF Transcript_52845/g.115299 Transcript_52845/m.115299 type:complete len:202 (-) Transcript_52845:113-718(-)